MVLAFKKGVAPHLNTFELGQHGRNRTNVWEYRGMTTSVFALRGAAISMAPAGADASIANVAAAARIDLSKVGSRVFATRVFAEGHCATGRIELGAQEKFGKINRENQRNEKV
jgi:hypothetical protein